MQKILRVLPLGFVALSMVAAAALPAHQTLPKKPVAHKRVAVKKRPSAPADEYFGHQKLSILGVRNTIHDLNIRYDGTVQRAPMVMNVGGSLEQAMHAWALKYPGDMWLGHNLFQLDQIYMRVPTPDGKRATAELTAWIQHDYRGTYYDKYLTHIQQVAFQRAQAALKASPSPSPTPIPLPLPTSTPLDTAPAPILTSTPNGQVPTPVPTPVPVMAATPRSMNDLNVIPPAAGPSPQASILQATPAPTSVPIVVPFVTPAPIPSADLIPLDPSKI